MFLIRYLIFGPDEKTPTVESYDESYCRVQVDQHWDDENEEKRTGDHTFFHQLEYVHEFGKGELHSFYNQACDLYSYEVPSLRECESVRKEIDQFVYHFLSYLLPPIDSDATNVPLEAEPLVRTYPRIIQTTQNVELCRPMGDSTFMVNRRLDFIYAYIIEKAIVDTLKKRTRIYCRKERSLDRYLHQIEALQEEYRTRVNARYIQRPVCEERKEEADSWVLYTRRSSPFYKKCIERLTSNETGLHYTEEALQIERIPFQQVLLMCGDTPGFIEEQATTQTESTFDVSISNADEWLSVPIWFSLFDAKKLEESL